MSTQTNGKIDGVPDGWRLVAFRRPVKGEWFISVYTGEASELTHGGPVCSAAIVVPDNVYGVRDPLKDVLAPHGYQAIAFRVPVSADTWISGSGSICQGVLGRGIDRPHVIVEPIPPPPKPKLKVMIGEWIVSDAVEHLSQLSSASANDLVSRYPDIYRIEERDA